MVTFCRLGTQHELNSLPERCSHGRAVQKHVSPSHWNGDEAAACLNGLSVSSWQWGNLTGVELVIFVTVAVEQGCVMEG